MVHINIWSQELESGVVVAYKGCRNAPRYCHELEIGFGSGNAVSFWGTNLQSIRDMLALALKTTDEQIEAKKALGEAYDGIAKSYGSTNDRT